MSLFQGTTLFQVIVSRCNVDLQMEYGSTPLHNTVYGRCVNYVARSNGNKPNLSKLWSKGTENKHVYYLSSVVRWSKIDFSPSLKMFPRLSKSF